jgi:hypothetical protein
LIALTLFVVVNAYVDRVKRPQKDLVEELRRRSVAVYLAAATSEAEEISKKLRAAADQIEGLRSKLGVMFWLIIAMNAVVASILSVAYRTF